MTNTDMLIDLAKCGGEASTVRFYVAKARQVDPNVRFMWEGGGVDYRARFENERAASSGPGGSNPSPPADQELTMSTERI